MLQILQPLLFAIYPIVFLYDRYTNDAVGAIWYLLASMAFGSLVIMFCGCYFYFKERAWLEAVKYRAIIASSLVIILFMTFGHTYNGVYQAIFIFQLERYENILDKELVIISQWLVGIFSSIFILSGFLIIKKLKIEQLRTATTFLLIFSVILLSIPGVSIFYKKILAKDKHQMALDVVTDIGHGDACPDCAPDVYYIILDGYARSDVLEKYYGFKNNIFLQELDELGFVVVDVARANYFATFLSLGSSLNMAYIDDLGASIDAETMDRSPLNDFIRDNKVSREFKQLGYQYVHMASTWGPTKYNPFADIVYNCDSTLLTNDFNRVFIEGTLLRIWSGKVVMNLAECHLNNFHWLGEVAPHISGKKFVFAHFVPPHHPYLFDREGNILRYATLSDQFEFQKNLWGDKTAYIEQLYFVNGKVLEAVKKILQNSHRQPIIIIQSDHGPHFWDSKRKEDAENYNHGRTGILLAVLTPDKQKIIPVNTPVNLFRYLLSDYFNYSLELFPDRIFKSNYNNPYVFEEISIQ